MNTKANNINKMSKRIFAIIPKNWKRLGIRNNDNKGQKQTTITNWIQAIIAFLLLIIAFLSFCIQSRLADQQEINVRNNSKPVITGEFVCRRNGMSLEEIFIYRNTGEDTAFGVWVNGKLLVVGNSFVAEYYYSSGSFAGVVHSVNGGTGDFTRALEKCLLPGQSNEIPSHNIASGPVFEIASALQGVVMFEVEYWYWDDSPRRSYREKELFMINLAEHPNNLHTKLSYLESNIYWQNKIDSLRANNRIGQLNHIYPSKLHYSYNPEPDSVMFNYSAIFLYPTNRIIGGQNSHQFWLFEDSLIIFEDNLLSIDQARKIVYDRIKADSAKVSTSTL